MKNLLLFCYFVLFCYSAFAQSDAERYVASIKDGKRPEINPFSMKVGDVGHLPMGGNSASIYEYVVQKVIDTDKALIKATEPTAQVPDGTGGLARVGGNETQFVLKINGGVLTERPFSCTGERTDGPIVVHPDGTKHHFPNNISDDAYLIKETIAGQLPSGATRNLYVLQKIDKSEIDAALKKHLDAEAKVLKEKQDVVAAKNKVKQEALAKEEEQKKQKAAAEKEKREARKWHTWKSADGQFTLHAKLVKYNGQVVSLMKKDGIMIEVPKEKISQEDIDWIFELANSPK